MHSIYSGIYGPQLGPPLIFTLISHRTETPWPTMILLLHYQPLRPQQAVATAHDAPDDTPVDGESPLPRPLFARPHPLSAGDNIFDDSDDDECLVEMPLPQSISLPSES